MGRTPLEDLLHRVNNLLGTIEIQADVAAAIDDLDAYRNAMRLILESARKTAAEVAVIRGRATGNG
ncbi:MAG: hypothetical protein RL398_1259 [Planctomycetota bacterium]|jgi:hypothetical protein